MNPPTLWESDESLERARTDRPKDRPGQRANVQPSSHDLETVRVGARGKRIITCYLPALFTTLKKCSRITNNVASLRRYWISTFFNSSIRVFFYGPAKIEEKVLQPFRDEFRFVTPGMRETCRFSLFRATNDVAHFSLLVGKR